jgi:hypothetical protein
MGGFCGGGREPETRSTGSPSGTQTRGSSPRPKSKPDPVSRTVSNFTRSFMNDLTIGLSTFGQTGEAQAETLRSKGYSDDVIKDYQDRTAATKARGAAEAAKAAARRSDDDSPAQAATSVVTSPATIATTTTTDVPEPPAAPSSDAEPEPGSAEDSVVEGAKKRKGRASTITTAPSGLLTTPKTRRRRSLMGGEEPVGLIS